MLEQNLNTSGKYTYWVIALIVIILLAGLIGWLVGNNDDISTEEKSEQALVVPEIKTESGNVAEQENYDFAEQLPQYTEDDWKFETESGSLPELEGSDAEYTQDLLAVSPQLKLGLFKNEQIKKTIFSINDVAQGLRPPLKRLREISFTQPFC